jgi:hypothetical protein
MEVRPLWRILAGFFGTLNQQHPTSRKHTSTRRGFEALEVRSLMAVDPFTIAVLPDTQYYAQSYPEILDAQVKYILDQRVNENIAFVSQLGDIVQSGESGSTRNALQWQRVDAAFDKLDGNLTTKPDGILPYSVALGNHDYAVISDKTSGTGRYEQYFGPDRYEGRSWFLEDSGKPGDQALIFAAGGYRFLHITLQFEPTDSDLAWAQRVIDRNPGLPTIITTHSYLNPGAKARQATLQGRSGSTPNEGNTGEQVFQKLIATNNQIFLVMNGHFTGEYHQTSTNNFGNPVFEMVADYQGRTNGGDGWLRLLEINPALNKISVETYSPTLKKYETDSNSKFSLNLNFAARFGNPLPEGYQVSQFQDGRVSGNSVYQGTVDTQLKQNAPNTSYSTSTTTLLVDAASTGEKNVSQVLLKFNSIIGSNAGQIPAGAKILNAKLIVNTTNPGAGAELHRMLKQWSATDTWKTWGSGIQTNNVEARSVFSAQAGLSTKDPIIPVTSELTINVTEDLQSWANGTANYGWVMTPWAGGTNGWAFSPSEAAYDLRPSLQVEWVLPGKSVSTFQEGTAGYTGTDDTMIRAATPTTKRDGDTTLWVDGPEDNGTTQALLRFANLFGTDSGKIPAGAVIESARLYLTTPAAVEHAAGGGATLNRLLQTWSEAATWAASFGGNGIQLNNTEARSVVERNTGSVQTGNYGFDVTESLKAWQSGAANNGWVLTANNSNGWAFDSSEYQAREERPKLVVVWSMPQTTVKAASTLQAAAPAPTNNLALLTAGVAPSLVSKTAAPLTMVSSTSSTVKTATVQKTILPTATVSLPVPAAATVWATWPTELKDATELFDKKLSLLVH